MHGFRVPGVLADRDLIFWKGKGRVKTKLGSECTESYNNMCYMMDVAEFGLLLLFVYAELISQRLYALMSRRG